MAPCKHLSLMHAELVEQFLTELGARREGRHLALELKEHETRTCHLPRGCEEFGVEILPRVLAEAARQGLISVRVELRGLSAAVAHVEAGSVVGFASSSHDGVFVFLRVIPKIGTHRMLELAVLAGLLPSWDAGGAQVSPRIDDALIHWTIGSYVSALRRLLGCGGIRTSHVRVKRELRSRVKGRLLVAPWLRNVIKGAPHLVPCEFPAVEFDNAVNRALRWAIHVGIVVARSNASGGGLAEELQIIDRQFAGVRRERPSNHAFDVRRLPPNLRHYADALATGGLLVQGARLGTAPGDFQAMSIGIDMNAVYERAFFQGLKALVRDATRYRKWPIVFSAPGGETRSTNMIPDVWVPSSGSRMPIVVDTKWKQSRRAGESPSLGSPRSPAGDIPLRLNDIYQVTAYAVEVTHTQQGQDLGCVAALLYPVLQETPHTVRRIPLGAGEIRIVLAGWNVSLPAHEGIAEVWGRIEAAATLRSPNGGSEGNCGSARCSGHDA